MYLLPAIDILDGCAVRLAKGDYAQVTVYNDDPVDQARKFESQGATWIHVVDLDGARTGVPENIAIVERIVRETSLSVEIGGGIRTLETLERLANIGAARMVLGTALVNDPELAHAAIAAVGGDRLTAGIDGGEINRALFETKSRPRFEMERIVFDTMEFHEDGAIAVAVLWRKDIDRVGADMDDLDSIASLTRQIEGVQIGITMTEKADGTVRVSVRTTKEMDASAICKRVGGGGHVRAAGASFTCGMDEAKAEILRVAKEQFHAAD